MAKPAPIALGLSVHTGWAVCVAAAGTLRAPRIVAREEIALLGDPERFVFHRAAELDRGEAKRAVARAEKETAAHASDAFARIIAALNAAGHDVVGCAIVAGAAAMPGSLETIIAAHPRIHTAEGCFYRDALRTAAEASGLATRIVPPKQVDAMAAKAQRVRPEDLKELLAEAGRLVGRPWAHDQKIAALAAWSVLAE